MPGTGTTFGVEQEQIEESNSTFFRLIQCRRGTAILQLSNWTKKIGLEFKKRRTTFQFVDNINGPLAQEMLLLFVNHRLHQIGSPATTSLHTIRTPTEANKKIQNLVILRTAVFPVHHRLRRKPQKKYSACVWDKRLILAC